MAKFTPVVLGTLRTENALEAVNQNFADISDALEDSLTRVGTLPNAMGDLLDMNSKRIINLPEPTTATEPIRYGELPVDSGSGTPDQDDTLVYDAGLGIFVFQPGVPGPIGPTGFTGLQGDPGVGIAVGGDTGQILKKNSGSNYDTTWLTLDKAAVGLNSVDNTSDSGKPVSVIQQLALDTKLNLTDVDTNTSLSGNSDSKVPSQKAIKTYVDNSVATSSVAHTPVRFTAITGTLATGFDNGKSAGGVTVATGDRFLYAPAGGSTTAGIYVAAASGAPTRATDLDSSAEFIPRPSVAVTEGTYIGTQWICTNVANPTLGSDTLVFTQSTVASGVSTATTITAAGLVTGGGDLSTNRTVTVTAATQTQAETATATTVAVTPATGKQLVQKFVPQFPDATTAAAFAPVAAPGYIETLAYYNDAAAAYHDGRGPGGAVYIKAASEPSHLGKISVSLSGGGTQWYEIIGEYVTPEMFGAVGDGDVTYMALDTAGVEAAIVYSAAKNVPVRGTGIYMIDGYKGNKGSWTNSGAYAHGGIELLDGARVIGGTYMNGADNWRCIFQFRSGNPKLENAIIDGDVDNHDPMILGDGVTSSAHDQVRGEAIIFTGGGTLEDFKIQNCYIKNTGHYGIGIQDVVVTSGLIDTIVFSNIGGDCIDGKYVTSGNTKNGIKVNNITSLDGCGHNYVGKYAASEGHDVQTVLDIPRGMQVNNVTIYGLDSYDAGQQGNDGVRFRGQVGGIARDGSENAIATNIKVFAGKLSSEGASGVKNIRGIVMNSSYGQVHNFYVEGCYRGISVSVSGIDPDIDFPIRGLVSNGIIRNSSGASTIAPGLYITGDSTTHTADISFNNLVFDGNEYGIHFASPNNTERLHFNNISFILNGVGIQSTDAGIANQSWSNISFPDSTSALKNTVNLAGGTVLVDSIIGTPNLISNDNHVIAKARQSFYDVVGTANDSSWTTNDAWLGGQRFFSSDSSGQTGEIARVGLEAVGATGSAWMYEIQASNSTTKSIAVARFRDARIDLLKAPVLPSFTVATLPVAGTIGAGAKAFVTDATAAFGSASLNTIVVGGSTHFSPVFSDGTNWRMG